MTLIDITASKWYNYLEIMEKEQIQLKTILITDDDMHIGNMLEEILTQEGYAVLRAYSGTEALMVLNNQRPDLVLLDLMLPGMNGEDVLTHIRDIPVIVVSAKAEISDKVNLLLGGAADYVTKPFDINELLARITVALRKNTDTDTSGTLSYGDITIDLISHNTAVSGQNVKLTKTEFAILKLLIQNAGQVIAKSVILDRISMDTPDCVESSLKVHISNIRRKLREISDKDYIEAVWGIGFKLREP